MVIRVKNVCVRDTHTEREYSGGREGGKGEERDARGRERMEGEGQKWEEGEVLAPSVPSLLLCCA